MSAPDQSSRQESAALVQTSRPPSYGTLDALASDRAHEAASPVSKDPSAGHGHHIPRGALACLLLQHVSSALASNLYQFAVYMFLVEVYKDTLAPASLNSLVSMTSAILFAGAVGNLVDRTPRLKMVRCAVALQKLLILTSFAIFLILFGPMKGMPAMVFHSDSSWREKILVNLMLASTITCASVLWLVNLGINVAVEKDWVTAIAQGDSHCLTMLNSRMLSIGLLTQIAGPMVVSMFTMNLSYPNAAKALGLLVVCCGLLELFWIQIVYKRFPILREDEERRGRGMIKLKAAAADQDQERPTGEGGAQAEDKGWRAEASIWAEFARMPLFFASLAMGITWLTTLHFDSTGTAHFKIAAGYSDFFLACMRGLCMISSLIGANVMPRIERLVGTGKTGVLGLGFGITCYTFCIITFFLEQPLERVGTTTMRTANTAVMFATMILARGGHVTFDLAEVKALQQRLEHHPRRNRMTALQNSMQAFFSCLKSISTIVFATQDAYKWTVLITLVANVGAMTSYLTFLRLDRRSKSWQ